MVDYFILLLLKIFISMFNGNMYMVIWPICLQGVTLPTLTFSYPTLTRAWCIRLLFYHEHGQCNLHNELLLNSYFSVLLGQNIGVMGIGCAITATTIILHLVLFATGNSSVKNGLKGYKMYCCNFETLFYSWLTTLVGWENEVVKCMGFFFDWWILN